VPRDNAPMNAYAMPLGPEDRAILALEGPTVAGHTCKVVLLGDAGPDVDRVRALVAERIAAAPMLTRRLGGPADATAWVPDEAFDVAAHVVAAGVDAPLDAAGLRAEVARLFEQRLDRSRPLWRMDVVPLTSGTAVVWRIHHALADGTAAMRFARALLWDAESDPAASIAHHAVDHADDQRRRRHLAGFLHRELARSRAASPFDGTIGGRREIAFAAVPLAELHDAAKRLAGATLNDAVLAVVAGALRGWLVAHHGAPEDVRVKVPVSLHHPGDDAGNRDSSFALALPLHEADPVARLRAVRAATAERKADHDADTLDALERDLAKASPGLERLARRIEDSPRRFAVNVSNVPGPRAPVCVLGTPVHALHSIAEIGERHALRIAVVSLAGTLCFGLCADPELVEGVQTMADGVAAEAAALTGLRPA
jgi:diacylglycerol O-acyltransferase